MHDVVIRGGVAVDGTGAEPVAADVAIDGDRVVAVGRVAGRGAEEIDARGQIVTPGFVDVHSHYDAQVTWDPQLTPSSWHGVTTVVMGSCGAICDGGMPTFMLTHWTRDRRRGPTLPLEYIVRRQTRDTARAFGLLDRGVLAPGFNADVNVIDYDKLRFEQPFMAYDLPAGGRRLTQHARGYTATICSGTIISRDDTPTGALPGKLVRGAQPAPR